MKKLILAFVLLSSANLIAFDTSTANAHGWSTESKCMGNMRSIGGDTTCFEADGKWKHRGCYDSKKHAHNKDGDKYTC